MEAGRSSQLSDPMIDVVASKAGHKRLVASPLKLATTPKRSCAYAVKPLPQNRIVSFHFLDSLRIKLHHPMGARQSAVPQHPDYLMKKLGL